MNGLSFSERTTPLIPSILTLLMFWQVSSIVCHDRYGHPAMFNAVTVLASSSTRPLVCNKGQYLSTSVVMVDGNSNFVTGAPSARTTLVSFVPEALKVSILVCLDKSITPAMFTWLVKSTYCNFDVSPNVYFPLNAPYSVCGMTSFSMAVQLEKLMSPFN